MPANGAPLRRLLKPAIEVIFLAVNFPVDVVERLPPQGTPTTNANETIRVVQVPHRLTGLTSEAGDFFTTSAADPCCHGDD